MGASDVIVYVPPVLFAMIALAFLVLWRMGIATSWQWSAGFAQTGTGFAFSAFPISPVFDAFVSGLIFIGAAYCYGSAVLLHFKAPMHRLERRLFALGYIVVHTYIIFVTANLRDELLLTDVAFAVLLGSALCVVIPKASRPADIAMIVGSMIVVIDTLARAIFFYFSTEAGNQLADFVNSNYNLAVHITTITICILFPFSALGAMASAAIDRHRDESEKDTLTGLLNRRGFQQAVDDMSQSTGLQGAVLICDIDHFKRVNDEYGHAVGDKVIVAVADDLRLITASYGHAARFGGEEFVIFLPGISLEDAIAVAQLLRVSCSARDWHLSEVDHQVTISFGVSSIEDGESSLDAVIDRADRALYSAKASGRNQVAVAPSSSEENFPPVHKWPMRNHA